MEKTGATRLVERVDCDVDYESMAAAWAVDSLAAMAAVDGTGVFHEMVQAIKEYVAGGDEGADGRWIYRPRYFRRIYSSGINLPVSPESSTTGSDTWVCAMPGHLSLLEALRA